VQVVFRIAAAVTAQIARAAHGEHEVADQGGVEPDLAVVQAELVFADLEIFFHRPAHARDPDQGAQRDHPALGLRLSPGLTTRRV